MPYEKFNINIYRSEVLVFKGTKNKVRKELYELFPNEKEEVDTFLEGSFIARTADTFSRYILVYFTINPNQGLVAHEMFHVTEFILGRIGMVHNDYTTEAWAYLLNYLIDLYYQK